MKPRHACLSQDLAVRSAVGRKHELPTLDGHPEVVERVAAVQHEAWSQARVRHLEVQLMCRVPAFVVEQEHGDRLAGGG